MIYSIGTKTRFGKIVGIHSTHDNPERYYFIIDKQGCVSYIPQSAMKGIIL